MKLIIFHPYCCISSEQGYVASIRIGYILNAQVATAGVGEQDYRLMEDKRNVAVEVKLRYMLKCYGPGELRDVAVEMEKSVREFNALKNKSSKMIVVMTKVKKMQEALFNNFIAYRYKTLEECFCVSPMTALIHPDKFHFYDLPCDITLFENKAVVTKVELLQMLLPDVEGKNALFFLDRHKRVGILGLNICYSDSEIAEDPEMTYGQSCFLFPKMDLMTSNEIAQARMQLEEPSGEFRKKIEQWAAVCYESPASNAGLEFFRENIQGFLPALKDAVLETPVLKNISDLTRGKSQTEIIIGQAPIEKIWACYLEAEAISEQEYNELLQIKKEQYPKYEGRWPVFFLSILLDDINVSPIEHDAMEFSRKSISVD